MNDEDGDANKDAAAVDVIGYEAFAGEKLYGELSKLSQEIRLTYLI